MLLQAGQCDVLDSSFNWADNTAYPAHCIVFVRP